MNPNDAMIVFFILKIIFPFTYLGPRLLCIVGEILPQVTNFVQC